MINLFILPIRIAFRLLPLICLAVNLAFFSSVSWVLLMLSLWARLCQTDCQFIILEIAQQTDWIRLECLCYLNDVLIRFDAFWCTSTVYEVEIFFRTPVFQVLVYICCFPQVFIVSGCNTRYRYITVPFYFDY